MKSLFNLTPKNLIIDQLKKQMSRSGIISLILQYNLESGKFGIIINTEKSKGIKLDLSEKEMTSIKKIYVNRIVTEWNERYTEEPKAVIIQFDLEKENFELFIMDTKDKVLKFDV